MRPDCELRLGRPKMLDRRAAFWRWLPFNDGSSRSEAAEIGGVTLQIVRDWVVKFNARGPGGLIDGKAPGKPSRLNDAQRAALVMDVERGPIPAIDGIVRWRLIDLCQWVRSPTRKASVATR
jgi:transposase